MFFAFKIVSKKVCNIVSVEQSFLPKSEYASSSDWGAFTGTNCTNSYRGKQ